MVFNSEVLSGKYYCCYVMNLSFKAGLEAVYTLLENLTEIDVAVARKEFEIRAEIAALVEGRVVAQ